jgi:hypothetical protein
MRTIILFDDNSTERNNIIVRLKTKLSKGVKIIPYEAGICPDKGQSYERQIATWLEKTLKAEDIALIACDKELGSYDKMPGLSATAITTVAREKGVPCCQYSRQPAEGGRDFSSFERLRRWGSDEITLEGVDLNGWVLQVAALFNGFESIRKAYPKVAASKTPASALARILEHAETESRIALYGSGDQSFLVETLAVYDEKKKPDPVQVQMRMTRVLGNWLYLSILRFPGILVNQVAAASYLNVAPAFFAKPAVQGLFTAARYKGPFAELRPWWWRHSLDQVLEKAGCKDGLALAKTHVKTAAPCLDPATNEPAGLYCMITRAPVSAANSRGGISWFPSGADLARIRKDKFDQITALVGMY